MNLEKELLKQNEVLYTPQELLFIKESDRLTSVSDSKVLSRLGLNENVKIGEQIKKKNKEFKEGANKFDSKRVFHITQIEGICKKYYLRFLKSKHFKGSIDNKLPTKLDTFEIAHGIKLKPDNSYMMAPVKSFNLKEKPKDPLFFYRINDDYYYLIHKWGNDLSRARRLLSIFSSPWWSLLVIFSILIAIITFLYIRLDSLCGLPLLLFMIIIIPMFFVDNRGFIKHNKWNSIYE